MNTQTYGLERADRSEEQRVFRPNSSVVCVRRSYYTRNLIDGSTHRFSMIVETTAEQKWTRRADEWSGQHLAFQIIFSKSSSLQERVHCTIAPFLYIYNYLRQGGNAFAGFCLSVCVFVCVSAT